MVCSTPFSRHGQAIYLEPRFIPKLSKILIVSIHFVIYSVVRTADSISQFNSTNLALKGIVALRAMSEISKVVGSQNDADGYSVSIPHSTVGLTYKQISSLESSIRVIWAVARSCDCR